MVLTSSQQNPISYSYTRGSITTSNAAARHKKSRLTNASSYFSQSTHAQNISAYKSLIDQMRQGVRPSMRMTDQLV